MVDRCFGEGCLGSTAVAGCEAENSSSRVVLYASFAGPGLPVLAGTAMAPEFVGLRVSGLAAGVITVG